MDALTALQTDFTPDLPTEGLSARGPRLTNIPLEVVYFGNSGTFSGIPPYSRQTL